MNEGNFIQRKLSQSGPATFSAYCIMAAFGTYFCMYAFRKPFTAGEFKDTIWLGIGFKTVLVASQVAGYTLSKFIGIKVISEMPARYRAVSILALIGIAEVALLLFAVTPTPWNAIWLFVNGLPLGMVFGLVIGFSGRTTGHRGIVGRTVRELYRFFRLRKIRWTLAGSGLSRRRILDAVCDGFDFCCSLADFRLVAFADPATQPRRRTAAIEADADDAVGKTGILLSALRRSVRTC